MKKLNSIIYETRFPNMNEKYYSVIEDKDTYLKEYSTYNRMLLLFLIKNTPLKQYDDMLVQNNDYLLPVPKEESQDMYQFLCNDLLTYFYIRSNIFVEKLSTEEKAFLDSKIDNEIIYDQEIDDFVRKTFQKLLYLEVEGRYKKNTKINFGPSTSESFFADNGSLIIGLRTELFVRKTETDPSKKYYEGLRYINRMCEELSQKMSEELGLETVVIQYSDYSVKKIGFVEKIIL